MAEINLCIQAVRWLSLSFSSQYILEFIFLLCTVYIFRAKSSQKNHQWEGWKSNYFIDEKSNLTLLVCHIKALLKTEFSQVDPMHLDAYETFAQKNNPFLVLWVENGFVFGEISKDKHFYLNSSNFEEIPKCVL